MIEQKYTCGLKLFAERNKNSASKNFYDEYERCLKCSGYENSKNNKKFGCFILINENKLEKKI